MTGARLGQRIKAARTQAGLTQEELARRLRCSRGAVANYETNRAHPPPERLAELAHALGVPLSFFFPTPRLLDGEPLQVLSVAQAVALHRKPRGHPPGGGWFMLRPERWVERLGPLLWVEVDVESALAGTFPPGGVLAVTQGTVVPGCRVVVVWDEDLVAGELLSAEGGLVLMSGGVGSVRVEAGQVFGSVVAVVDPAAAEVIRASAVRRRRPRRKQPQEGERSQTALRAAEGGRWDG
jgi:transcriptional regulator with XRE-family HTH domain